VIVLRRLLRGTALALLPGTAIFAAAVARPEVALHTGSTFSPSLLDTYIFEVVLPALPASLACLIFAIVAAWFGRPTAARRALAAAVILISVSAGIVGSIAVVYRVLLVDHYERYGPILRHTTEFPHTYEERKFQSVRTGATEEDVVALLGPPLWNVRGREGVASFYSTTGRYRTIAERGFHQRAIVFKGGRVARIVARYHNNGSDAWMELAREVRGLW
jgi:hypothetical protein